MKWTGQAAAASESTGRHSGFDDGGFVMVALLVGMAVTAVWMGAALPTWRQQAIREKEAELIFRGEAIARAIYLYRQKNGQQLPPSLDTLVSQRFLRKAYLDPITGEPFLAVAGATGGAGGGLQGGIIGVRSTSNDTSIRIYSNQQTYSQWAFDFTLEQLRAGGGPALGLPGGDGRQGGARGGRAGQPDGRGGLRGGGGLSDGPVPPILPGGGRQGRGDAPPGGRGGGVGGGRGGGTGGGVSGGRGAP